MGSSRKRVIYDTLVNMSYRINPPGSLVDTFDPLFFYLFFLKKPFWYGYKKVKKYNIGHLCRVVSSRSINELRDIITTRLYKWVRIVNRSFTTC